MKIITIFLIAFIFFNSEKAETNKNLQCKDFKIGNFQFINRDSNRKYVLKRTKYFQIEQTFDLKTNKKVKKDRYYKIFWKDDCEYNLILDTTKSDYNEIDFYLNSKGGYKCFIRKIEGNCATVETNFEKESFLSKTCKYIN